MSAQTGIEWADSTFNPWIGCTKVSPACDHCYAERDMSKRLKVVQWGAGQQRQRTNPTYWKAPLRWDRATFAQCACCGWRGEASVADLCPRCNDLTLWHARRRVFCASLADVFDNEVDPVWRIELFNLIRSTPNLDWLLLTKRIGNAARMIADAGGWTETPWPNVWLGATVVNQDEADRDIPKLLAVPARVRFLSIEPMLGPINLRHVSARYPLMDVDYHHTAFDALHPGLPARIGWIICGGESGPHARPMHPDWVRSLRDQCAAAGVPFLFKQWGEWCPRGPEELGYPSVDGVPRLRMTDRGENGQDMDADGGNDVWMNRAGKKAAGRQLDGRTHTEFPA